MQIKIVHSNHMQHIGDLPAGTNQSGMGDLNEPRRIENNIHGCWNPGPGDWYPPYNPWPINTTPIDDFKNFFPKIDPNFQIIMPDENTRKIETKVSGFKPSEISVSVEGNLLIISASKTVIDNFNKPFSNSHEIMRHEKVESADLEYGVLTVILKGKKEKSTKIPVKEK